MSEQTMTATELLDAGSAGRTAHMETRVVRGEYDPLIGDNIVRGPDARPITEDVRVDDAEVKHKGQWRKVLGVFTDLNDDERPIFLDLDGPKERVLIAHKDRVDTVVVRGLNP
jgi:hypothetical protein